MFLSEVKEKIESNPRKSINAFWWVRWQNEFEHDVDGYKPYEGEGFTPEERGWFAQYMQCLVFALQTSSKAIAGHYGKQGFATAMSMYPKYHCYGADHFVGSYVERLGLPPGVVEVTRVKM